MFFNNNIGDLKKLDYYNLLNDNDIIVLENYVNSSDFVARDGSLVTFSNNETKEIFFNIASQIDNKMPIDKALIFLTTRLEAFKWGALDNAGIGQLDIAEYVDTSNDIKKSLSYAKYLPFAVVGIVLYKVLK